MLSDDVFEQKLKLWKGSMPEEIEFSAIYIHDTLKLSWASAQSVFGEQATPEIAIEICKLTMERRAQMEKERTLE